MKKLILILILLSIPIFSQNKLLYTNAGKALIKDSLDARMGAVLDIDDLAVVKDYEPVIADSSILLYSGGVWSIFDLSEALSATANNAINITYPDANTISFNDTDVLLLDPLTLEINGSNQLTVIGGTGGSVGNADSLGGVPASSYPTNTTLTDSLSKYVDKASTQDILGQKNFLNNKTVFGTTTNDSVGVRGNLDVDGTATIGSSTLSPTLVRFRLGGSTINRINVSAVTNSWKDNLGGLSLVQQYTDGYNVYQFGDISTYGNGTYFEMMDQLGRAAIWCDSFIVSGNLNVLGNIYKNGILLTGAGSVGDADSLAGLPGSAYVTKTGIDGWSSNLYTSSANELRLGKSYNTKRFNNGAYTDVWNIDYVIPPYNLSATWLNSIEHRTDYYNDTLNTVTHSDILNVDGTGTPIWRTNDVRIMGNEMAINVGDLPDSTALDWSLAGLTGNKVILSEYNKTAGASRFPMPVKGYEFKFGSTPYYTYPYVYGFYSDLTTNTPNLETAYHFYGKGDFPSYFGGDIILNSETLGNVTIEVTGSIGGNGGIRTGETVQVIGDSPSFGFVKGAYISDLVPPASMTSNWDWALPNKSGTIALLDDIGTSGTDSATVKSLALAEITTKLDTMQSETLIATAETLDSLVTAFWNGTLGSDTTGLWSAVNSIISGSGVTLIGTSATLDSIVTAFWNGSLGGSITITYPDANTIAFGGDAINLDPTTLEMNGFDQLTVVGGGSTFDSTYAYQRITALEDSINSFRNILNSVLTALDTCGCGVVIVDNTPPAKPTSYTAIGGTSQTQYVSTWTDPTATDLDSIRWYEGSSNDSTSLVWIASIPAGTQTYTRTGRTANTVYWSAVKAIDDSGNVSYFSNIDSARTLSAPADTGFAMYDAEDGFANLTLNDGSYISTSTDQVYAGTYSYKFTGDATGTLRPYIQVADFTAKSTLWLTYRIYIPASTTISGGGWNYSTLFFGGGDVVGFATTGTEASSDILYTWQIPFGTPNSTNWSTGTWHKIEVKYQNGTGTAQDSVWVDGTLAYGISNGTETATITSLLFGCYNWSLNATSAIYFDNVILSDNRLP